MHRFAKGWATLCALRANESLGDVGADQRNRFPWPVKGPATGSVKGSVKSGIRQGDLTHCLAGHKPGRWNVVQRHKHP
ncbi:hypothetical protein EV191_102430 [Tamaricihabitans halophyticus]|uniref:Uncharacterized protein n=1 Tax=Tamaricihabitans halophyticus TaxID=1262583 RepID=A0A4R2R161_9PSEU|nr:hypothetical protein EV191_102430 [Tamaricihabitans halophyticus]